MIWAVHNSYPDIVRTLLLVLVLLPTRLMAAQQTPAPITQPVGTYRVTVHNRLSSSCEVVEPATLMQYRQYDALMLGGAKDESYSPDFGKGDFIEVSEAVPKTVLKSAKKSGFEVRVEPSHATGLSDEPVTNGTYCPDLQQAISKVNRQRDERRVELQKHLHRVGSDILPPVPIRQVQPQPAATQAAAQSSATPTVKKQGTVILAMAVGIDGKVHDVKVARPLDSVLDQKAIEAVRQWQFSPARMRGLPVPVEVNVEVNFHLY
jgi:TonB family protein